METVSFTHTPETALKNRGEILNEALKTTLAGIEITLQEQPQPTEMHMYGRVYPLRSDSVADHVVALSQQLHKVSKETLTTMRGEYHQELMAAKLESFFETYEILMSKYAELLEQNPEIAERILTLAVNVIDIARNQVGTSVAKSASNDEKYIIAA